MPGWRRHWFLMSAITSERVATARFLCGVGFYKEDAVGYGEPPYAEHGVMVDSVNSI